MARKSKHPDKERDIEVKGIIAWEGPVRPTGAGGQGHHRVLAPSNRGWAHSVAWSRKAAPRIQAQRDRRGGLVVEGGLCALVLLTLVDVLERASSTEFHADP